MKKEIPIAIAFGDGIGPEIMNAVLYILKEAKCPLEYQSVEIGEKAYHKGNLNGIDPSAWDVINNAKAFLKAPITTPQGGGYKSLNVTIRNKLGLFANVRPCVSYNPIINTSHPDMDVVVVRENEEDLYCGIEYVQSPDTTKAYKIITYESSRRIVHFAFEYAKKHNRKKVTCMTKDNILKKTDGLFHKVFDEIAKDYPDIINEHYIIDIGSALLATTPETFDVVVLPNLYGDILSDVLAQMSGSIGICGSANIGEKISMFEAVHGSAISLANKNIANPSALILAAVQMLNYLNLSDYANNIHNAWLVTIEEGFHTKDIFHEKTSKKLLGTKEFSEEVVKHFSKKPAIFKHAENLQKTAFNFSLSSKKKQKRELVGVDITIFSEKKLEAFFDKVSHANEANLHLKAIMNRGVQVWPDSAIHANLCDQYRLRFLNNDLKPISQDVVTKLIQDFDRIRIEILNVEYLYMIEGTSGF